MQQPNGDWDPGIGFQTATEFVTRQCEVAAANVAVLQDGGPIGLPLITTERRGSKWIMGVRPNDLELCLCDVDAGLLQIPWSASNCSANVNPAFAVFGSCITMFHEIVELIVVDLFALGVVHPSTLSGVSFSVFPNLEAALLYPVPELLCQHLKIASIF